MPKIVNPITIEANDKVIMISHRRRGTVEYMNEKGLENIIAENPDVTILEIDTNDSPFHIPDNLGILDNMNTLVLVGFANLPNTIVECKSLQLISLVNSDATLDVSPLAMLPSLEVLTLIKVPNVYGLEPFQPLVEEGKILVIQG
jgi:hypothetical protein